jgi:molybdate transport system substrate-binding protein
MRLALLLFLASGAYSAELTVAAASDLAPLESELAKSYGSPVRFSFGASGALLRQIENGAPFDVYLSASSQYVEEGIRKGGLRGPATLYAIGRIALWSRAGNLRELDQLKANSILHVAIANPAYAPYGAAARQALEHAGLWSVLASKIVFGENIRQTLQFAESGNADAAIVAWSLVHNRGGVLLPASLHAPVRQSGAVVSSSRQLEEAGRFLKFLTGPRGRAVLEAHGLEPPPAGLRQ